MERKLVVPVQDWRQSAEPLMRLPWGTIRESASRVLPLIAAVVPATLIVAYAYASGFSEHFRIPPEFIRVSVQDAAAPFTWALFMVIALLAFAHEAQKYGVLPTIRMHLAQLRGMVYTLLIAGGVILVHSGQASLLGMARVILLPYLALWTVPSLLLRGSRWIVKRQGRGDTERVKRVGRRIDSALDAVQRHLFGATPPVRGSMVSNWYVAMAMLALAFTLLVGVPYYIGSGIARTQSVFTTVGSNPSDKRIVLAVYGDKVLLARVDGRVIRALVVRNLADIKDVDVRREEVGRLHW
jgi:hypothetical protein